MSEGLAAERWSGSAGKTVVKQKGKRISPIAIP